MTPSTENLANAASDEDAGNTGALTLPIITASDAIVAPIPIRAAERAQFLQPPPSRSRQWEAKQRLEDLLASIRSTPTSDTTHGEDIVCTRQHTQGCTNSTSHTAAEEEHSHSPTAAENAAAEAAARIVATLAYQANGTRAPTPAAVAVAVAFTPASTTSGSVGAALHVPYGPQDALFNAPVEQYDVHESLGASRSAPRDNRDHESACQALAEISRALEEGAVPRYTPSPTPSTSSWNRAPSPVKTEDPLVDVELAWSRAPSPVRTEEEVLDEDEWNSDGQIGGSDTHTQGTWSRGAPSPGGSESPVSAAHHEPYDPHDALFAPVEPYDVHQYLRGRASESHSVPHQSDEQRAWQALEAINRAIEEGSVPWYRHSPSPTATNSEWSRAPSPVTVKSEEELLDEVDLAWSRAPSPVRSEEEDLEEGDSDGDTQGSWSRSASSLALSPVSVPYDPHDALFAPVEAYDVHESLGGASHSAPSRDNHDQESAWKALEEINRAIEEGAVPWYTHSPSPTSLNSALADTEWSRAPSTVTVKSEEEVDDVELAWSRAPSPVQNDGIESDGDGESLYESETHRIFDPYTETWTSVSQRAMSPGSTYSSGPDYYSEGSHNERRDIYDQEEVGETSFESKSPSVEKQRFPAPAGHDDLGTPGATSSSPIPSYSAPENAAAELKKRRRFCDSDDDDAEVERAVKRRRSASPADVERSNASGHEESR